MDWFHRLEDVMVSFFAFIGMFPFHLFLIFPIGRKYFTDWSDFKFYSVFLLVFLIASVPNLFICKAISGFVERIFATININNGRKTMRELIQEHDEIRG